MSNTKHLVLLIALILAPLFARAEPKPTIVLVHGAFADGSSWSKVIPLLQKKGLKVVAVQNPLTSLADDEAATRRTVEVQEGPVVLVGHSWGGVVITQAGGGEKIKSLVYIAALAPKIGEAAGALSKDYPPLPWQSEIRPDGNGVIYLSEHTVATSLAPDLPKSVASVLTATQGATPGKIFGEPVSAAAWQTKPSFYLVTTDDRMIQPAQQRAMAKTIGAQVRTVKSSHMPMLSQPQKVADIILEAAK